MCYNATCQECFIVVPSLVETVFFKDQIILNLITFIGIVEPLYFVMEALV